MAIRMPWASGPAPDASLVLKEFDPGFRGSWAWEQPERFRARWLEDALKLHEGGDCWLTLPAVPFTKEQISPTRDSRLVWMQSIIHCTHYIAGAGEQAYLNREEAPEIQFLKRDPIERSDEAYTEFAP